MAKGTRKRFNKSGRDQSLKTTVASNLKILESIGEGHSSIPTDDSNALVLERKTVVTQRPQPQKQRLSKKRRKQLEKLLDQKEKKAKRGKAGTNFYYFVNRQ